MEKHSLPEKSRLLTACAVLCSISIIFIILAFSKWTFHSDCANFLFLAKEQYMQKKIFPEDFHYTTEIFGLTSNIFMTPFVGLISNDYLLHEIGSILYLLVIILLLIILFKDDINSALISIILLMLPYSYTMMDMYFFQSAYTSQMLVVLFFLICSKKYFKLSEKSSHRNIGFTLFLFSAVYLVINLASLRQYVLDAIPAVCAGVILLIIHSGWNIKEWFKQRKLLFYLVMIIGLTGISLINYSVLCRKVGFNNSMLNGGLISPHNIWNQIGTIFGEIASLYGITHTQGMLTFSTARSCIMYVFCMVCIVIVPFCFLININKITSLYNQFLALFCIFSNFITLVFMIFFGYGISRYYLTAFFNNILLMAIFLSWILKNKFEKYRNLPIIAILFFAVFIQGYYYCSVKQNGWYEKLTVESLINPKIENEVVDFLHENNLTYGYATFWYAYSTMIASNSTIQIAAYDQGNPLLPYYFNGNNAENPEYYGVSERLYSIEQHPGRCFIMIAPDETIPDRFFVVANDILRKNGFTILVYDKNIYLYDELKEQEEALPDEEDTYISQKEIYVFMPQYQTYSNKCYTQNNQICLLKDAELNLNPIDLKAGTYIFKMEGSELNLISVNCINLITNQVLELESRSSESNLTEYILTINEDSKGWCIQLKYNGDRVANLSAISISLEQGFDK